MNSILILLGCGVAVGVIVKLISGRAGRAEYQRRLSYYSTLEPATVGPTPDGDGLIKTYTDGTTVVEWPPEDPVILLRGEVPPDFPSVEIWMLAKSITRLKGLSSETPFLQEHSEIVIAKQLIQGGLSQPDSPGLPSAVMTPNAHAFIAFLKGTNHMEKRHWTEAEEHFQKALHLDPDFAAAHNQLGLAVGAQSYDREDEAKGHFEAALSLVPGYAGARKNLQALEDGHHIRDFFDSPSGPVA